MRASLLSFLGCALSTSVLASDPISSFPNSLILDKTFDPIKAAYWTGLPHHRRTPFSVSPDGKSAYIAYLDSSYSTVVVQQVDTTTFAAVGTAVEITGYEAAGLVAQNDGFALMATVNATGTVDLPTGNEPIVGLIRYKNGVEAWTTMLNGPGVHASDGLTATPDANGDLVYSEASGLYAAYFVVTAYTGDAAGHFGDSIQYVDDTGSLQTSQYSSTFGCSHNTGIGLEAADAPPFASVCAEDQGDIWLNTDTQYMSGVKIANENTTNGVSGEPMGGMSGSYSNLALFLNTTNYIFAWQSRGALDLTLNAWMGSPYTQCSPRWLNHNVAIATMSKKDTLTGAQASSVVGAAEGDTQVNWITESSTEDHQNVHVATLNSTLSLVSWETLTSPDCQPVPLGCTGTYAGTSFQFVDNTGAKIGSVFSSTSVFVSGDMTLIGDKLCWPYVNMTWDLSAPKDSATPVSQMSFACVGTGDSGLSLNSSVAAPASSSTALISTSVTVASSAIATSSADDAGELRAVGTSHPVVTPFTTGPTSASYGGAASTGKVTSSAVISVPAPVSTSAIPTSVSTTRIRTSTAASSPTVTSSALGVTSIPAVTSTSVSYGGGSSARNISTSHALTTFSTIVKPTLTRSHLALPSGLHGTGSSARKMPTSYRHTTFSTIVEPSPTPSPLAVSSADDDDDTCEW